MEAQRIVLIGALAVLAYLMILAWNQDYNQPGVTTQPSAEQAEIADLPVAISTNNDQSDIPSADIAPEKNDQNQVPVSQVSQASESLIEVETDIFKVAIDPKGGDIVRADLKAYPAQLNQPDQPLKLLDDGRERLYIAQSGLIGEDGPDSNGRPLYQSAQTSYQLNNNADTLVVDLTLVTDKGVKITKRYSFSRGDYRIGLDYLVDNTADNNWQANFFAQLKRDDSQDPSKASGMRITSFLGFATTTTDERYKKIAFDDDPFKEKVTGGWIALLQHYFVSAWIPDADQQHTYQTRTDSQGNHIAGLVSQPLEVAANQQGQISASLYVGPKIQSSLAAISPALELTVDYGWLWFIAQPLFWLLSKLHSLVGNWGWAIVLTTLCVKLAFFKLSATSYRSMANMRRMAPELQRLKERYGDDRQAMSAKMMELYKKEKINPLGGCLPILVQMPVFIALYWVLMESVELRQAPFMLWLNDLSVKDPYFILPIFMGVTMFVQQMLNPEPPDPMQAKVMKMMPIIFTFFFLWFPSGLVVYWVVNNLLSIAQQWVITRQIEKEAQKT